MPLSHLQCFIGTRQHLERESDILVCKGQNEGFEKERGGKAGESRDENTEMILGLPLRERQQNERIRMSK